MADHDRDGGSHGGERAPGDPLREGGLLGGGAVALTSGPAHRDGPYGSSERHGRIPYVGPGHPGFVEYHANPGGPHCRYPAPMPYPMPSVHPLPIVMPTVMPSAATPPSPTRTGRG